MFFQANVQNSITQLLIFSGGHVPLLGGRGNVKSLCHVERRRQTVPTSLFSITNGTKCCQEETRPQGPLFCGPASHKTATASFCFCTRSCTMKGVRTFWPALHVACCNQCFLCTFYLLLISCNCPRFWDDDCIRYGCIRLQLTHFNNRRSAGHSGSTGWTRRRVMLSNSAHRALEIELCLCAPWVPYIVRGAMQGMK